MILVFKTDPRHTSGNRELIALATDLAEALVLCWQCAENEGEKLGEEQLYLIATIRQTQGYSGEGEFDLVEVKINTLL